MTKLYICIILLIINTGCSSFKEEVGAYVTEAIKGQVVSEIDSLLQNRGLSISEFEKLADTNRDNKVDKSELLDTVRDSTKDYVLLETKDYIENKISEADERIRIAEEKAAVSSSIYDKVVSELESQVNEFWKYILGILVAYLGKQIWSAKKDGKRDERIAVLEKLLGKDLDGDGKIGSETETIKKEE